MRFLHFKPSPEGLSLKDVSPIKINTTLVDCAGEPKHVKKLRDGSLLVECHNDTQAQKFLTINKFSDVMVEGKKHETLNQTKGVIKSTELNCSTIEEIKGELGPQNVQVVERIESKKYGPTSSYLLTFDAPSLPKYVKVGYLKLEVKQYVPAPLRCFKCYVFGHISGSKCGLQNALCRICCQQHLDTECNGRPFCPNCKDDPNHEPLSRSCPTYQRERRIKEIQIKNKITLYAARKLYYEQQAPTFSVSFAEKVSKNTTITRNTNLYKENNISNIKETSNTVTSVINPSLTKEVRPKEVQCPIQGKAQINDVIPSTSRTPPVGTALVSPPTVDQPSEAKAENVLNEIEVETDQYLSTEIPLLAPRLPPPGKFPGQEHYPKGTPRKKKSKKQHKPKPY